MEGKYVLVSRKSTTSFVLEKRARYFEKQRIAEGKKLCILCEIRLVVCFLATQVVFFLLLFGYMLDTIHQRSVSGQSSTSFQENSNTTSIGIPLQTYSNANVGRKMSCHPKKASLSKLYEKHLEKEKEDFARERETPPPISRQSIRECFQEDCSLCRKKRKDKM